MRIKNEIYWIPRILWCLFGLACMLGIRQWFSGEFVIPLAEFSIGPARIPFGIRMDALSSVLFTMVSLLAAVVARYSVRYLDGERGQIRFFWNLLFTAVAVSLLVTSNGLVMLMFAWIGSSLGLHRLLTFYSERPNALRAARRKFVVSRLGDLALLAGCFLTFKIYGTFEFSELFQLANAAAPDSTQAQFLPWIGFLFALGAMTKSAQYPFHSWLPDTMETPAPVSALMHAGIINAGGFLMIRLSPLLQHSDGAHILLLGMGAFTAAFGSLVMITQNNIKRKLAYSTISQMGMMMFACGLGLFSVALFHMVAHSFYKAHAFLSTGTLVEESKKVRFKARPASSGQLVFSTALGAAVLAAGLWFDGGVYFAHSSYLAVLLLGVFQVIGGGSLHEEDSMKGVVFRVGAIMLGAFVAFAGLEYLVHHHLRELVPVIWDSTEWSSPHAIAIFLSYLIFASTLWIPTLLKDPGSEISRKLYLYLWNGGYFGVTRQVGSSNAFQTGRSM